MSASSSITPSYKPTEGATVQASFKQPISGTYSSEHAGTLVSIATLPVAGVGKVVGKIVPKVFRAGGVNEVMGKRIIGKSNLSGFSGRSGFELRNATIQPIRNKTKIIDGMNFSGHALDKMQNRGIMPSVVKYVIQNGRSVKSRTGTKSFYDSKNHVQVIINSQTNKIITVKRVKVKNQ